jgi:hypothetical protein
MRALLAAAFLSSAPPLVAHSPSLQGPTSSGKTSLVEYLARKTGHKCVFPPLFFRFSALCVLFGLRAAELVCGDD